MKKFKGQYLVVEQTLLFFIGLSIAISTYTTFSIVHTYITHNTAADQFDEISLLTSGGVLEVYKGSKYFNYIEMGINVPKYLANQIYKINVSDTGVSVSSATEPGMNTLNGIYNVNGTIDMAMEDGQPKLSALRKFKIIYKKDEGNITIS